MTVLHYLVNFAHKDRHAYEFYFIAASYVATYFKRSGIKLSNKYSLLHDRIHYSKVFVCLINPTHASHLVQQGVNL